eukprot:NODE_9166_length_1442_cov_10.377947.p1 GENE.NODE_9166_length_1442_cov_10.377947~~NODE_9166_length_1442_cov_10.377947.p1  ORF type:complete len:346 (-),score=63.58 NODE_9166_length_1442_cov_10.377947:288-1325(-)
MPAPPYCSAAPHEISATTFSQSPPKRADDATTQRDGCCRAERPSVAPLLTSSSPAAEYTVALPGGRTDPSGGDVEVSGSVQDFLACCKGDRRALVLSIDESLVAKLPSPPVSCRSLDGSSTGAIYRGREGKDWSPANMEGTYSGQMKDGIPHGTGVQWWPNGCEYSGGWKDGAAQGLGTLIMSNGGLYEGEWFDGRKHGRGFERLAGADEYRGSFVQGQRHGHGVFQWTIGSSYVGEFYFDVLHGHGVITWANGRSYSGQWVSGMMNGTGTFTWQDGRTFTGSYLDNKKHGPGVLVWPDDTRCPGIWAQGMLQGLDYVDDDVTGSYTLHAKQVDCAEEAGCDGFY